MSHDSSVGRVSDWWSEGPRSDPGSRQKCNFNTDENVKEILYLLLENKSQQAVIAQLGERQTEDLKVPGSIPGRGKSVILIQMKM